MLDFLYPPLEWRDWRDDWPLARCLDLGNAAAATSLQAPTTSASMPIALRGLGTADTELICLC